MLNKGKEKVEFHAGLAYKFLRQLDVCCLLQWRFEYSSMYLSKKKSVFYFQILKKGTRTSISFSYRSAYHTWRMYVYIYIYIYVLKLVAILLSLVKEESLMMYLENKLFCFILCRLSCNRDYCVKIRRTKDIHFTSMALRSKRQCFS